MLKAILNAVVYVPVLLGMVAARSRPTADGLLRLLAFMLAYGVLYFLLLYILRDRWVG